MESEEKRILSQIPKAESTKFRARSVSAVLNRLIVERGYAAEQANQVLHEEWAKAVGPMFTEQTKVGKVRNGVLQVLVSNHIVLTELDYRKTQILKQLQGSLPAYGLKNIRFHISR